MGSTFCLSSKQTPVPESAATQISDSSLFFSFHLRILSLMGKCTRFQRIGFLFLQGLVNIISVRILHESRR
ncbi:hypothetical protein POPTR_018G120450v4 [Populus trichocarpa]|uniref:Uncharacterized protein n=1 Tax=Populus trichocarpa TaxID=3694 RepID=A0ACC0RMT5_POPTR|nr:hypothetical protein POPTR_018G120450v4 [Populus trichocarpa]